MLMSRESKLIVFVAVLASLLEIIDSSIVNVAIPTMMGNLGATLEDISMIVTGYAIANAVVLPLSAWLGNQIGRRKYYLGCILAFILTSVACGLAPNLWTLIVFRIIQGAAGGALLPTSQALIYEQFPKEKAGIAGAVFGMSVMIGPTLGPVMGGYLTDNFGWRSIFNINLPLGCLALFIGYLVIKNVDTADDPARARAKKAKMDTLGLVLLCLGIGCLQYVLERGEADDWFSSKAIVICSLLSSFSLPTFVWWELRVADPIINLRLFLDPIVRNGVLLMSALGFFLYSVVFILPIFLGRSLHYDATQIGEMFIPGSLLTAMVMPFVGRALAKTDPRRLIVVGLISLEVCLFLLSRLSPLSGRDEVMRTLYVRGFGMAFLFVPINSSILSQFKGLALGQVSGLLNLSRQIGGSIGIALVATMLSMRSQQNYLDLISHVSLLNPATQLALQQAQGGLGARMSESIGIGTPTQAALRTLYFRVQNQVFMMSFNQLMFMVGLIFLLSFIPLWRLRLRIRPAGAVDSH